MPPGWYADPVTPGLLRWWDGQAWSAQTAPDPAFFAAPAPTFAPPPPVFTPTFGAPNPAADLRDEAQSGRRAVVAVLLAALAFAVVSLVTASQAHQFMHDLHDWWVELLDTPAGSPPPDAPPSLRNSAGTALILDACQIGLLVAGVMFLIWFRRAANIAQRLGLPAKRSPVWAVLGFMVPIVSFWYPYQVARDLTPAGHPARTTAKLWWALFLAMQYGIIPMYLAAWSSTTAALVIGLVVSVCGGLAALQARDLIAQVNALHAAMITGRPVS